MFSSLGQCNVVLYSSGNLPCFGILFLPQVRNIFSCNLLQSSAGPPPNPCRHSSSLPQWSKAPFPPSLLLLGQLVPLSILQKTSHWSRKACSSITRLVVWALFGQKETHPAPFLPDKQTKGKSFITQSANSTKQRIEYR